jgi:uncharacterized membrane protein SpoIIM required for sporulation
MIRQPDAVALYWAPEWVRVRKAPRRDHLNLTTTITDTLKIIVGKRWSVMLALFLVELVLIFVVANAPFFPNEYNSYYQQYNNITPILSNNAIQQILDIFSNNFRVALIEIIPILGVLVFGISIYSTARVVEVIGIVQKEGTVAALTTLFALPSTWLELPAYCIATVESLFLAYALFRVARYGRSVFIREVRFLLVNIILIAGVLIVAATVEVTEIQLEAVGSADFGQAGSIIAFLTWVPALVIITLAVRFWRRAKKQAPELEEKEKAEDGLTEERGVGQGPTGGGSGGDPGVGSNGPPPAVPPG